MKVSYDNLNRVIEETDPLSHSTLYQYDADGELTQRPTAMAA